MIEVVAAPFSKPPANRIPCRTMELTVRAITASEVPAYRRKMSRVFGFDPPDLDDSTRFLRQVDLARTRAAFDGDELIGTCAAWTFDVTVPGGALPMGGTTFITVQPTHRRRGVLTAMMRSHLDEIHERGEPLAGLWASESSIYGRFGFGVAAEAHTINLDGGAIEFAGTAPPGRVRLVEADEAATLMPPVYERARAARCGMLTRTDVWWENRVLYDAEHVRGGASAKRWTIYEGADGCAGYAIYRAKGRVEDFPCGEIHVLELVTVTAAAHAALWRHLARIDLFPHVTFKYAPPDDELPWLVTEPRRVRRTVTDSLWLRIMDVPAALEGRAYGGEGRVVLGLRDPFLPGNDGSYELEVSSGSARCKRTSAAPDVQMEIDVLGAIYFGAHRLATLARAGRLAGSEAAIVTVERLFAWPTAPWCAEVF